MGFVTATCGDVVSGPRRATAPTTVTVTDFAVLTTPRESVTRALSSCLPRVVEPTVHP